MGQNNKGNPPQKSGMEHQLQKSVRACQLVVCSLVHLHISHRPLHQWFTCLNRLHSRLISWQKSVVNLQNSHAGKNKVIVSIQC